MAWHERISTWTGHPEILAPDEQTDILNTSFPVSGLLSTATLCGVVGDKGLGLKINNRNWVRGLVECASRRLPTGSAEWSPWMRHFPIEVIKMIEDGGKLVHLTARWRGTCRMCRRPKEDSAWVRSLSLSLSLLMYCIHGTYARRVSVSHAAQNGTGSGRWATDAHRTATSFSAGRPAKNIYHHTQSNLHFNLTFVKSERERERENQNSSPAFSNSSPVILPLC